MMMTETSPLALRSRTRSRMRAPSLAPMAASGSPRRRDLAAVLAEGGARTRRRLGGAGDGAAARAPRPLPPRQLGHLVVDRRDVHAHVLEVLPGQAPHAAVAEQRPADQLPVEEHVVVDAQLVDQGQVLVDGVDAEAPGVVDGAQRHLLAADEDPAGVGLVEAAEDLDQGRLAGAVVADEAEHLALAEAQVDVAEGGDPAEALGRVLDPQGLA